MGFLDSKLSDESVDEFAKQVNPCVYDDDQAWVGES